MKNEKLLGDIICAIKARNNSRTDATAISDDQLLINILSDLGVDINEDEGDNNFFENEDDLGDMFSREIDDFLAEKFGDDGLDVIAQALKNA